ncbi:MAG: DUF2500 domain-containing protein [Oscillospiraceae bacterium]|nr:DUF2500 domain-containing protein [Oscillospiraceae bacterium]
MQIFVVIWFILFFCIIAKNIGQFIENENSPVLTVPATVADKRKRTHHHHHDHGHHHSRSYYVTFEMENGERMELRMLQYDYRELNIGDRGMLTYQGTRYKGFER